MSIDTYIIFLITTIVIVFSPGPAAITMASQGAVNGVKKSMFGVAGIASANVVYFLLSATGIASIILASNLVFTSIKWIGVIYLVYLGMNAIFSKSGGIIIDLKSQKRKKSGLFTQGFIIELANPKALLYFSALLPQFIHLDEPIYLQLFIMGVSCLVVDLIIYSLYAFFGYRISKGVMRTWIVNLINRVAGGFLIFAGLKMASLSIK
jgi:homoserine/homoserine lactone efflux protein